MVYVNWCQNVSFYVSKYKINKTHVLYSPVLCVLSIGLLQFVQLCGRVIPKTDLLDIYLQLPQQPPKDEL